jgi:hypothetical protein
VEKGETIATFRTASAQVAGDTMKVRSAAKETEPVHKMLNAKMKEARIRKRMLTPQG